MTDVDFIFFIREYSKAIVGPCHTLHESISKDLQSLPLPCFPKFFRLIFIRDKHNSMVGSLTRKDDAEFQNSNIKLLTFFLSPKRISTILGFNLLV